MTFNSYAQALENLYKYNGKEEQKETGWLDYGARMYMPDLGRWGVIDLQADKYNQFSPYNYVLNVQSYLLIQMGRMVWAFQSAGKKNSNNKSHQFWQQDNHPIELSTNAMIDQRLHYIHMNSVKERIIDEPEHYVYSRAKDYSGGKGFIDVDFLY